MLKALVPGLLAAFLGAAGAQAATPLEGYLAARDRHVEAINQGAEANGLESVAAQEERALAELEGRLRAMIGPLRLDGFPAEGRINLETLLKELGYGRLDGLFHDSARTGAAVVATTEELLKAWLKEHQDWWPDAANPPQDIPAALRSEAFYSQAISTGAQIAAFGEIPVTLPGGSAFAMLAMARQDIGPVLPDLLVLALVKDGRVFVASLPAEAAIEPIPACQEVWRRAEVKAEGFHEAYRASKQRDEALLDKAFKAEEDGDAAFRRCFADRVEAQPAYPDLLRRAQAMVDGLGGR
ncbi:hypothetical protein [Azospirillum sp. SYSU D00513]|uniref:hypothetical protein n=1 Tax=Azospirillum sp. SYSU D00513 TaxID=2812561 RepID=UPI001A96535C|nr:hypothetical protein [Azospirillum sp. SYSU D00513]